MSEISLSASPLTSSVISVLIALCYKEFNLEEYWEIYESMWEHS